MTNEFPVKVGSMLFTMVDPERGHEAAYNRWYERDHFYAGCLVGPWLFAGSRWVAPRGLKALRFPAESPIARPTVGAGSYVAIYWIHAGRHDEHHAWAIQQVRWLYANGRGFTQRAHVHTLLYAYDWTHYRDDDPVPIELAHNHHFPGMVSLAIERSDGVGQDELDAWLRENYLPRMLAGSTIASCSTWSPMPQQEKAPMDIPRVEHPDRLDLQLYFLDAEPMQSWSRFVKLGEDLAATRLGRVVFASPWLPTIVGTDTYTDQLW
jgi:hypothetical protein